MKISDKYQINNPQTQLEITVKRDGDLEKFLTIAEDKNIKNLNITDKNFNQNTHQVLQKIKSQDPKIQVTGTISIRNHYFGGIEEDIKNYINNFIDSRFSEILVVSGSGRRKISTVEVLDWLEKIPKLPKIAVAFNPNLIEEEGEKNRLESKLKHNFVKKIYLQICLNTDQINQSIKLIRGIRPDIEIVVCVVIPSKTFLHSFSRRPWNGVIINDDYLSDIEEAERQTQKILELLEQVKIPPLLTVI